MGSDLPADIVDIKTSQEISDPTTSANNRQLLSLLSNLDGLTPEGLDTLMGTTSNGDAKSAYVDTSDNNSCISAERLKPPSQVTTTAKPNTQV